MQLVWLLQMRKRENIGVVPWGRKERIWKAVNPGGKLWVLIIMWIFAVANWQNCLHIAPAVYAKHCWSFRQEVRHLLLQWRDSPHRALASSIVRLQISLSPAHLLHPLMFSSSESLLMLSSHLYRGLAVRLISCPTVIFTVRVNLCYCVIARPQLVYMPR
jgi:hypothetical protein